MLRRCWLFLMAMSLLILLLPACDGKEEKTSSITTATALPTPIASPTGTPSPVPSHPVKIGAIASWSGPLGISGVALADPIIKLVEKQVKDMGGILGGRDVKVIRYDNRASVAEAISGASKLLSDDKVSALVFGGVSGAEMQAVSAFAEEHKILYVAFGGLEGLAETRFSVNVTLSSREYAEQLIDAAITVLKPKTVAFLGADQAPARAASQMRKDRLKAAGVKMTYEEYAPVGTVDFMPYLTKIKFDNPDALILELYTQEGFVTIARQIMELGGWGEIKVMSLPSGDGAVRFPGAQGWYMLLLWLPGLEYPGSVKFLNDFQGMFGTAPTPTHVYYYNCLWTAIHAIELAGTDTDLVKIAQAARSGKLEWETPMGRARFTTEGSAEMDLMLGHVEEGKLVPVPVPE